MKAYGFSVIGKYHIDRNLPCQDFNLIIDHADGVIAVIADGVSSSEFSDVASKIASETFMKFTQDAIKAGMNSEEITPIFKQAFTESLQAILDYALSQGHRKSQYDTTLTGLYFTKSFVCIGHSGDGGVIGLKPNGLYVSLTQKISEVEDGKRYVTPLSKPHYWKFYSYQEIFARILMATDGVYDTFYSHLLPDQKDPINIQMIERFMNSKALNKSLLQLDQYKKVFAEKLVNAKLTDDDMTCVLLVDESITLERQPDAYYAIPDWEKLRLEFRKKLYPKPEEETIIEEDPKDFLEEEATENPPISEDGANLDSSKNLEKTEETIEDTPITFLQEKLGTPLDIKNFLKKDKFSSKLQKKIKYKVFSLLKKYYVFDSQNKRIQYNPLPLFESINLKIFSLKEDKQKVVYLYQSIREDEEKKLIQMKEASLLHPMVTWMPWPQELVYDKNSQCVGFVTQALPEYTYLDSFLQYSKTHQDILNVISSSLVLAKNLCVITSFIHNQHWVIQSMNPKEFFIDSKHGHLYFIDILNIGLTENAVLLINTKKSNLDYLTPSQLMSIDLLSEVELNTTIDVDINSNRFSLAIVLFQLLMRGYHPYSCVESSQFVAETFERPIARTLQVGASYFFVKDSIYKTSPQAPLITTLPQEVNDLFSSIFLSNTITKRDLLSAKTWYENLNTYGSYKI